MALEKFETTIDAKRGSPPMTQTLEGRAFFQSFLEHEFDWGSHDANYGLNKPGTQALRNTLARDHQIAAGENQTVVPYQNTVAFFDAFINQVRLSFATQAEPKKVVVFTEDPSYDRVITALEPKIAAGDIGHRAIPFRTAELDLKSFRREIDNLHPDEVPVFYRTPINNPTGIDTVHQNGAIYDQIKTRGGLVFSDAAYHFLDAGSTRDSLGGLREQKDFTDVCVGQFSKVLGQESASLAIFDNTNHPVINDFLSHYQNLNFTDFDQKKIAFMTYLLSDERGNKVLRDLITKAQRMADTIRAQIADSNLSTYLDPGENEGYFELVKINSKETLKQANIEAVTTELEGQLYARLSLSLPQKTIAEVVDRLETVISKS